MKNTLTKLLCFALCLFAFSCKKKDSNTTPDTSSNFTAKINGSLVTFTVQAATLLRDSDLGEKRFDVTGLSGDGKIRLTLTVGEESEIGNNVPVLDNTVTIFNDDDPNTPDDESQILTNAFFTLSNVVGNNSYSDVFAENGHIIVSGNTHSGSTGTVTGSFTGTLKSTLGGPDYTITEGSFTNLKYTVLN